MDKELEELKRLRVKVIRMFILFLILPWINAGIWVWLISTLWTDLETAIWWGGVIIIAMYTGGFIFLTRGLDLDKK